MKSIDFPILSLITKKISNFSSDGRFSEIFKGSIWAFSANVLSAGLMLLVNIIVARYFGPKILGVVTIIESMLILVTIFTVLGTDTSLLRLIPEHTIKYSVTSAYKVYHKAQFTVILMSVITGATLFLFSSVIAEKVFSKPYLSGFINLAAIFVVFKSLMLLNTEAVRGLRLIRSFALLKTSHYLTYLILLLIFVIFYHIESGPVYAFLLSFAVTGIVGWVVMEITFKRRIHLNDEVSIMPIKDILSISVPMFMNTAMNYVMAQTGIIMIGMFRSEAEVGYYGVSVKLATLTVFVLASINSMIAPKFAEYFILKEMDNLFYVAKRAAKLVFWSTMPIILVLLFFGKFILSSFFGNEFTVAYPALVIILAGQFINCISGSTACFMNMTGHQGVLRNILLVAIFINISINFMLIPKYGIIGAAIASMACMIFWNISSLCFIGSKFKRTTGYIPFPGRLKRT